MSPPGVWVDCVTFFEGEDGRCDVVASVDGLGVLADEPEHPEPGVDLLLPGLRGVVARSGCRGDAVGACGALAAEPLARGVPPGGGVPDAPAPDDGAEVRARREDLDILRRCQPCWLLVIGLPL